MEVKRVMNNTSIIAVSMNQKNRGDHHEHEQKRNHDSGGCRDPAGDMDRSEGGAAVERESV